METFSTVSDSRKRYFLTMLIVWLVLSALALLGLKVALITCLFFEVIILLTCVFCWVLVRKTTTRWRLEFEENTLLLTNLGKRQSYEVWDVPAEDFVLKQTKAQRKRDCGDLRIRNTMFTLIEVQNFSATKQYIETHF